MRRNTIVFAVTGLLLVGGSLYIVAPSAGVDIVGFVGNASDPIEKETRTQDDLPNETYRFGFTEVSSEVGFEYKADDQHIDLASDSGIFVADYDRDGWTDILAVGGPDPVLFDNDGGEFERSEALPEFDTFVRAAFWYDHDNDGWQDLLVLRENATPVLLENQDGSFVRHGIEAMRRLPHPMGASIGDYDRDGHLDIFIIQHGDWNGRLPNGMTNDSVADEADNGEPNRLLFGTGSFEDPFTEPDKTAVSGDHWSLATSSADLNGDGWTDIHVANDFFNDIVYLNRGNGTFERVVLGRQTDRNGMSSEVGDVDRDGKPEVYVTNIYYPEEVETSYTVKRRARGNNLLNVAEDGNITDAAPSYGVAKGGWGWATVLADFDNDGDLDLMHTTRSVDFQSAARGLSEQAENQLHRKFSFYRYPAIWERDGVESFELRNSKLVGLNRSDGRGLAKLDFDRDGNVEVALASGTGSFKLYETHARSGNAIQVAVSSRGAPAVGTTVTVRYGNEERRRFRTSGSDFLSQNTPTLHFGLGKETAATVEITWHSGETRTVTNVSTGTRLHVPRDGPIRRIVLNGTAG